MQNRLTMELEHPSWETFSNRFARRWKQGQHVFINGQTGSGKTELMQHLLAMRTYSVLFVTKPRDPIFKSPQVAEYKRMTEWKPTTYDRRILLSAKSGDSTRDMVGNQHDVFGSALDDMFHKGGWTVGFDETLWIANRLRLGSPAGDFAYLGRALGLTGLYAVQRPVGIPVIIPQNAEHAFLTKTGRREDLKTIAELGGDPRAVQEALRTLRDKHDFLYVDTTGELPLQVVNTHA